MPPNPKLLFHFDLGGPDKNPTTGPTFEYRKHAMNDDLKQLSALTALNNMMRGGHFNICTIDSVGKLLGIEPRGSDAYNVLHTLHCIDWNAMPQQLREAVPGLINECLGIAPAFQFTNAARGQIVDLTPDAKPAKRGIMHILGLS